MSFLDSISSLFQKKSSSVLGIDIGSSAIKVVEIGKRHGRAVLRTYGELALGPYAGVEIGRATNLPPAKISEAIRDILKEAKTTTVACGTALPMASSLITFVTIPPVSDKQMVEVVTIEARKYIPVPMNEVMLDWSLIPREEEFTSDDDTKAKKEKGSQDVLVVAIHNEYLASYQEIMNGAGLTPSFFEIEIFSAIRGVVDQGIQAVMIIDMGARITKLYIVERGILRGSHIINKGGQDITLAIAQALSVAVNEAETMKRSFGLKGGVEHKDLTEIIMVNLDYIFYETNTVLQNYQKKYNKSVVKIVLTGGGVLLKGLIEVAKASLQTEVVYADPFGKIETPAMFADSSISSNAGPEFAVAIGAALRRLQEID